MSKTVRHIIWDWNGTLYDDSLACVNTLNLILERRGLPLVDIFQYRNIFRFPVKDYYEILGFDFAAEDWDAMAREFHSIYHEESQSMELRCGVLDLLHELKTKDIPMSVLSAAETRSLEKLLNFYGLREYFGRVQGLDDIYAGSKIHAGERLLMTIAYAPDEVLLVGDTTHDNEVARALECQCVLLCGGHQARSRLEECGCPVFDDLKALREYIAFG